MPIDGAPAATACNAYSICTNFPEGLKTRKCEYQTVLLKHYFYITDVLTDTWLWQWSKPNQSKTVLNRTWKIKIWSSPSLQNGLQKTILLCWNTRAKQFNVTLSPFELYFGGRGMPNFILGGQGQGNIYYHSNILTTPISHMAFCSRSQQQLTALAIARESRHWR